MNSNKLEVTIGEGRRGSFQCFWIACKADESPRIRALMESAPNLLAALKALTDHAVECLDFGSAGGRENELLAQVRAAIAKAEGAQ